MENALMTDMRALWDDSGSPDDVSMSNPHARRWKCDRCGQSYKATMATMKRAYGMTGYACPVCAGITVAPGYNDLGTVHPDIASRLDDPGSASGILATRRTPLTFSCTRGHPLFNATIRQMRDGYECPLCRSGLLTDNVGIASEWDYVANHDDPSCPDAPVGLTSGSSRNVHWRCHECGHMWMNHIVNRCRRGQGCPVCAGRTMGKRMRERNAERTPFSDIPDSRLWDDARNPDSPDSISATSIQRRWFICGNGHHVRKEVRDVSRKGLRCRYCAVKDPVSAHGGLMELWAEDGRDPALTPVGYSRPLHWHCRECGQDFTSRANPLVKRLDQRGTACPYCSFSLFAPGVNDLGTTRPDLAEELSDPSLAARMDEHDDDMVAWVCRADTSHGTYMASPAQRVAGVRCPLCEAAGADGLDMPVPMVEPSGLDMDDGIGGYIDSILPDGEHAIRNHDVDGHGHVVDMFVPSRGVAFCFNDFESHNEYRVTANHDHDLMDACARVGVKLFIIWEDDWRDRAPIVRDMVSTKLGLSRYSPVYARKCRVEECDSADLHSFLDRYHIQGHVQGSTCLRLVSPSGDTVAGMVCMTDSGGVMTIRRYATSGNVPGGFSRLLRHAIKLVGPSSVITFSDDGVSDGGLYARLGFVPDKRIYRDYSYVVDGRRVHKFNYRIKRFMSDPGLKYRPGLTEHDLARLNGLVRVYDAGKIRWRLDPHNHMVERTVGTSIRGKAES